jgi:hypothetical protein
MSSIKKRLIYGYGLLWAVLLLVVCAAAVVSSLIDGVYLATALYVFMLPGFGAPVYWLAGQIFWPKEDS